MAKIAVDYDDVLIPFLQSFFDWYNHKKGHDHQATLLDDYSNISESYGHSNQYWADHMNEYHSSGLSASHSPIEDAIETLRALSAQHEIVILTSRPSRHRVHLEKWVNMHAPDVFSAVHMFEGDQNKPTVGHEKGLTCIEIGATHLIDDNPFYIDSAAKHGVTGILFGDHSWNKHRRKDHLHAPDWKSVGLIIRE